MATFEEKLAEARERIKSGELRLGFDKCAAIAREVVAEKDAEITRLETALRFLNSECLCGAVTALDEEVAL